MGPSIVLLFVGGITTPMQVIKRNGQREACSFDKITQRLSKLSTGLAVNPSVLAQKVVAGVVDGIHTSAIDTFSAETAACMATTHHDYGTLAGRIAVSNLQKNTLESFSETMELLYTKNPTMLSEDRAMAVVRANAEVLDKAIDFERDFLLDYFAFQTLERAYLLRVKDDTTEEDHSAMPESLQHQLMRVVERPQHMYMRVAVGIHFEDVDAVIDTYHRMSKREFTHATPTLFNACFRNPQMSSCFLNQMRGDSIGDIFDTVKQCALISKSAGGIGMGIHNVRAKNSPILGTNGTSNGIVPMLRVFDATARYVDQGGGKRKGSFAIYLEPWHADIEDFLLLKQNQGKEESKTRDLFLGLWTPDLFWKRLQADADWTLFSPDSAPGLHLVWGDEFEALYEKYEMEGRGIKTMKAMDLFMKIHVAAYETGAPYINFKDSSNRRSNHQHLGTITNSNLCTEILQYNSKDEVAVCNLASISLPAFLLPNGGYDFDRLMETAKVVTRNLNKVIDNNYYPVPEARHSNMKHRPIGVGVQGLADVFAAMGFAYDSPEARALNKRIFEVIYYGCVDASCELAEKDGAYGSYLGSPFSKGILQFDMWPDVELTLDWSSLKERIAKYGMRNSLLTTVMPTASTSQIMGNNEACEAFSNNIYARVTLAGKFFVVNKWLVRDLDKLGMWNSDMSDTIIAKHGSIQDIPGIPDHLKQVYRTVWEIKQLSILEMNAARAPFIDQSQSQNIFMPDDSLRRFLSLCIRAWELGVKTLYYIRVKQKVMPDQFTVKNEKVTVLEDKGTWRGNDDEEEEEEENAVCESCSA